MKNLAKKIWSSKICKVILIILAVKFIISNNMILPAAVIAFFVYRHNKKKTAGQTNCTGFKSKTASDIIDVEVVE